MEGLIVVFGILGVCLFISIMILKVGIKGKDKFWIAVGSIFTSMFISLTIEIISDVQDTKPVPKDTVVVFKK